MFKIVTDKPSGFAFTAPLDIENVPFLQVLKSSTVYTVEELKWDILILQWRGISNDLK